jgi:hypothetical protein
MRMCSVRTLSVLTLLAGFLWSISSQPIHADTITKMFGGDFNATFSGTLPNQGTALLEQFNLPSTNNLTFTTTSYASGGFEPSLILYNSAGQFVAASEPFGVVDPSTGLIGDTKLTEENLPAGMYTLALTDFLLNQSITATNLSDGFTSNFGSGTTFVDTNGNSRTGDYSVSVSATTAPAPEPGSALLALLAIPAFALLAKRIRRGKRSACTVE